MEPSKRVQIIKVSSVIFAVIVFLGFLLMKQVILGIILAVGVLLLGAAVIHMYRTDFSGESDD